MGCAVKWPTLILSILNVVLWCVAAGTSVGGAAECKGLGKGKRRSGRRAREKAAARAAEGDEQGSEGGGAGATASAEGGSLSLGRPPLGVLTSPEEAPADGIAARIRPAGSGSVAARISAAAEPAAAAADPAAGTGATAVAGGISVRLGGVFKPASAPAPEQGISDGPGPTTPLVGFGADQGGREQWALGQVPEGDILGWSSLGVAPSAPGVSGSASGQGTAGPGPMADAPPTADYAIEETFTCPISQVAFVMALFPRF